MSGLTYLRVRRRRNTESTATLRLDGLDNPRKRCRDSDGPILDNLADLSLSTSLSVQKSQRNDRPVSVFWKKVNVDNDIDDSPTIMHQRKKRQCRVVDAVLEDEDGGEADGEEPQNGVRQKRRRLMITDSSKAGVEDLFSREEIKKKKPAYRVLDPAERLVDDSLKEVLAGEVSIELHYKFVTEDSRLACQSRNWLTWCCEGGNLLHACALWNNVETANRLLTRNDLHGLTEANDSEGRTPYEIAVQTGHSQIVTVLEAFGANVTNYVVDIYCLEGTGTQCNENFQDGIGGHDIANQQQSSSSNILSCELQGGVGYWDEQGELVFEKTYGTISAAAAEDVSDADEEDSNDEGWAGNDYPDDEGGEGWTSNGYLNSDEDESTDDDYDFQDIDYRARHAQIITSDMDGFDSGYGIYGQNEPEYDDRI